MFGIIQGITEWLPISSTGHMILLNEFVTLNVTPEFWEMFKVVIQFGSILAVVLIFWKKLFPFDFTSKEVIRKDVMQMWFKVVVGCIPAGLLVVFGLDEVCDALFQNYLTVAIMLILFGVLFIVIENRNKNVVPKVNDISEITYKTAFIIGIFQLLAAVFPGTSRSGSTIVGGLLLGVSRTVAAEFTFFLAVPTMLGASLLKLVKFGFAFSTSELLILIAGMVVAFAVSVVVIRFLMDYIKRHDFKVFGWYRIVLGIVVKENVMTTKKPVATLAKKEEVKAAPAVETKVEVKEEVKATPAKAEEKAAKAPAKKAAAKKETAKKETVKKETAAKAPAKKAAVKKEEAKAPAKKAAAKKEVKIAIQFADKNYTSEDLANIANDVWVYDYNKKASELKDVQLYVKPEESKVYYVFNNEIVGDFNI